MPEATVESTEQQPVQTEQAELPQEEKDAESAFLSGFAKAGGEQPPAEAKEESTQQAAPEEKAPEQPSAAAPAAAPEAPVDPWADVPSVVRQQFQAMHTQMRNLAGQFGGLNSSVKSALAAAKTAATDKGGAQAAPSDKQIAQAAEDPEEWKKLLEDYPDWAKPLEGKLAKLQADMRAELARAKAPSVDVGALKADMQRQVDATVQANLAVLKEQLAVESKHPDWQQTVNTPEFKEWSLQGGPSLEAYGQHKAIERADPARAEAIVNAWTRQYPQWWADRGVYIFDPTAKGALKLLDGFQGRNEPQPQAQKRQQQGQTRLERAMPAKSSGGAPPSSALSDEAAFLRGFKGAK